MGHVSWIEGPAADRAPLDAPPRAVVLLEDRAQVRRAGRVKLAPGRNRLVLRGVSPILQDLSLRAEVDGPATVADARVRRGLRTERAAKPEDIAALAAAVRDATAKQTAATRAAERALAAHARIGEIVARGMDELPQDVAWGLGDRDRWVETFEALFERGRAAAEQAVEHRFTAEDARRAAEDAHARALAADRPDHHVEAYIELDLVADDALEPGAEAEISVHYTVPNALWRPVHRARLDGDALRFESRAAVWQHTGEDWTDVDFAASTARTSLGTTAPLLDDDLLTARRREEKVTLAAREVEVQRTGPKGGGPATGAVDLPGVDDGGEVRHLTAGRRVTIPGDGRPVFVDLFGFEAPAARERVLMAEADPAVHLRVEARHTGRQPILAGPVELVRDSGTVGWTETLYVAPGGPLELGFGPDDALRAVRRVDTHAEIDPVDKWTRRRATVHLYLSNIGPEDRAVRITERLPVSEVEEVRVEVLPARTTGDERPDRDGLWTIERVVPARGQLTVQLGWQVATAPGIQGV